MCPEQLVLLISTLAISISKDRSNEEIGMLSVIFSQLGDTLATILASNEIIEENKKNC